VGWTRGEEMVGTLITSEGEGEKESLLVRWIY
jgi:hypothetical protein